MTRAVNVASSTNLALVTPALGVASATSLAVSGFVGTASTGAITMPVGTTAQRPASPVAGMQRINTTTGYLEVYNGGGWHNVSGVLITPTVEYLVVAGAGGGGGGAGTAGIVIVEEYYV